MCCTYWCQLSSGNQQPRPPLHLLSPQYDKGLQYIAIYVRQAMWTQALCNLRLLGPESGPSSLKLHKCRNKCVWSFWSIFDLLQKTFVNFRILYPVKIHMILTRARHYKSRLSCADKTLVWNFFSYKTRKKYPTSHIKCVKTVKKHVKMVKMHDFSSLGVQISRFCANSAKCCAVPRP